LRRSSSEDTTKTRTKVLFFRDFKRFTGGDLKVWDYFNHVRSSPRHNALIRFTENSVWSDDNPWRAAREHVVRFGEAFKPDVLFVSGVDWQLIERADRPESPIPIVNLIQHIRHACPDDKLGRYRFLPHKAIRICVSPEVTHALERTERVRGPLFTIPDAIDLERVVEFRSSQPRDVDVLVIANKQPDRGREILGQLNDAGRSHIVDVRSPQDEVLGLMGRAAVTVYVPNPKEGFYLPALEGMALGTIVVCPDCIGNRSYCLDRENCFRPAYDVDAIVADAREALAQRDELGKLIESAAATAARHDLRSERTAFLEILERVDELWATA
jgi:glycosyltransferase involved in cell wall biosynthesis